MIKTLDTVLLLALPASGKSEVRRYLDLLPEDVARRDFHMGDSVQLDDFPYVHLMRCIDHELAELGQPGVFFRSAVLGFLDALDWGTLIELVNLDHDDMMAGARVVPASAALDLFDRIDRAAAKAGAPVRMAKLDESIRTKVAQNIEAEALKLLKDLQAGIPASLEGKTLVIEFARGGPQGALFPLSGGYGYLHSLEHLSPAILEKAVILYIWVTPEESRRKNQARTNPDDPGSILHHGVPLEIMLGEYGVCDMSWLEEQAEKPGSVTVQAHGRTYHLPIARFDNRIDKTSFLREPQADWKPEQVEAIHEGLRKALDHLAGVPAAAATAPVV